MILLFQRELFFANPLKGHSSPNSFTTFLYLPFHLFPYLNDSMTRVDWTFCNKWKVMLDFLETPVKNFELFHVINPPWIIKFHLEFEIFLTSPKTKNEISEIIDDLK